MAKSSSGGGGGGGVLLYGVVIDKALHADDVSVEQLMILRNQARAAVDAQGNLVEALAALENEITKRTTSAEKKLLSETMSNKESLKAPQSFLIHLADMSIAESDRDRIEQRLKEVFLEELAKTDSQGSFATSPLSDIRAWGLGPGGTTAGLWVTRKDI